MYSQQPDSASSNSAKRKFSYLFLLLALLLLAVIIAPPPVFANGITVSTFADDLSVGNGQCSLREAITNANSDADGTGGDCAAGSGADTIYLGAGTYVLTKAPSWNDAKSGDLDVSSEITIVGMGAANTIIDASAIKDRVFEVTGKANISNLTITGGSNVHKGGGLLVQDGAQLVLDHVNVSDNRATSSGGGIANLGGSVVLTNVQLDDNYAAVSGGGVYNAHKGEMQVSHTAVLNNRVGPNYRISYKFGGGIKNYDKAVLTIENSTISGNKAADKGGGIYNHTAYLSLNNVTLVENHAYSDAGAIDNVGWAEFGNSIIAGNTAGKTAPDCRNSYGYSLTSLGYNLLRHSSSCPGNPADQIVNASDLFVTVLAPLGNYGGATPTYALLVDSPALDNANTAVCPSDDQRGITRPQGEGCDIGAYELEVLTYQTGPIFTVNVADDVDDELCDFEHCSLREAILAANAREGKDTIIFDLAAMGSDVIAPTSPLPEITDPVVIDGFGFAAEAVGGDTAVTIDGSNAGDAANGFVLSAGNSGIFGLTITNFAGSGVVVLGLPGNTIQNNQIFNNGALGIDLNGDGPTSNDNNDADAEGNDSQNYPYIVRAVPGEGTTLVEGTFHSTADTTFYLEFYLNESCDPSGFGEGQQLLGSSEVTTDANGDADLSTELNIALLNGSFITALATNEDGSTSEFSACALMGLGNDSWPRAYRLPLTPDSVDGNVFTGNIAQFIDQNDQSRWYKFQVVPNSQLIVTLTDLPENYDLTVYKDIAQAYDEMTTLNDEEDLTRLTAEFAPDAFSPDAFSPDAFSPDAFSPDAFSPDAFSPDAFSPDAFSPDAFSPDAFSPDAFSPDAFSPDAFSPDAFSPDAFSPDAFSPDAFSPDAFSPDAFSSAQTRSLIAVSAFEGKASEGIRLNTWENNGDFYIRVRGRNGVFNPAQPFNLHVELLTGQCADVNTTLPANSIVPTAGGYKTIILTDMARMQGSTAEKATLQTQLNQLAGRPEVAGVVVNVGADTAVSFANTQSDTNPACPFAKNMVAQATKNIVDAYWDLNPLEYVVIVGNDDVIPFFRHPDQALLANEKNYVPPVRDNTASQASLKLGYVLSQDAYGARTQINRGVSKVPVPLLGVGRLVETAVDATGVVNAYLATTNGVVATPTSSLVTGYDFLTDAAEAVSDELAAGIGTAPIELIAGRDVSPEDVRPYPDNPTVGGYENLSWTADHLRDELLGNSHDIIFLAGHFSASSALGADYESRLLASELANSSVDLTNAIIFSAGCHSGYNIVNAHGISGVTPEPDWAQAVAQKFGTLIAGTGYQYGDTDFIEYSERLYLDFSKELRAGTGPVSIGEAMVRAKQTYLANTPELRPIHEKALLQATIFGLPMLSVDMPQGRGGSTAVPANIAPSAVTTNPGAILNLHVADLNVTPALTPTSVELDVVGGEEGETVTATYLAGGDKTLTNPAELVLPVLVEDVTATDFVLRGVGFKGGTYADMTGILPLTGAPTTEIRGVHAPFLTSVFYPIEMTQANYYDVLAKGFGNGRTSLNIIPAQFLSDGPASTTGTLRHYTSMNFKLFYSDYIATSESGNAPAQAAAPVISGVQVHVVGSDVQVQARVFGDPSAGMQEVWATITGLTGPYYGQWQSVMLTQSTEDSTVWTATFPLNGTPHQNMRVMLQAVNGVGLVSLATNLGRYYTPTVEGSPSAPDPEATTLQFISPPASGEFGGTAVVSAKLTASGDPVSGQLIQFALGSQQRTAVTNASGIATVEIRLLGLVGSGPLQAAFAGNDDYQSSFITNPFNITPQGTNLVLSPVEAAAFEGESAQLMATLTGLDNIPLTQKTVMFVITGEDEQTIVVPEITDNAGRARLQVGLPLGSYSVDVYFASVVPLNGETVNLTDERYQPASASGTITVVEAPAETIVYISLEHPQFINGVWYKPQDILAFNSANNEWSLYFDGSDVGLYPKDIDAFALLEDDSILMSFSTPINIKHFGQVDDSDIIRFVPTSLGEETAGTFEWYFDGSDVGLKTGNDDIDALAVLEDGRLLISLSGHTKVNGIPVKNADLLSFTPNTLGVNTSGQWEFFFDGSDIGLTKNTEDIDGISVNQTTGELYFSTLGAFQAGDLSGNGADIVSCAPVSLGNNTSCQLSLFWQSVLYNAHWLPINAIHVE